MAVGEVVDARTARLDAAAAWALLQNVSRITVAKGKKYTTWNPRQDNREDILRQVMGPSGNLRAPACRVGTEFVVGFNEELYGKFFSEKSKEGV